MKIENRENYIKVELKSKTLKRRSAAKKSNSNDKTLLDEISKLKDQINDLKSEKVTQAVTIKEHEKEITSLNDQVFLNQCDIDKLNNDIVLYKKRMSDDYDNFIFIAKANDKLLTENKEVKRINEIILKESISFYKENLIYSNLVKKHLRR